MKEPLSDVKAAVAYVREKNLPVGCFAMNGALTVGLQMGQSLNNAIYQVRGVVCSARVPLPLAGCSRWQGVVTAFLHVVSLYRERLVCPGTAVAASDGAQP